MDKLDQELPRLQKVLAAAGVASRRASETLIIKGRVTLNGKVVRELGVKVDPQRDQIRVDGNLIETGAPPTLVYIMLNKPAGYQCTVADPHADKTVLHLIAEVSARIYPVGRLDEDSEGLLLLTNDGDFAYRMTHPRYHVPKTYVVAVRDFVEKATAKRLAEGLELSDGKTAPAELRFIDYDDHSKTTTLEMTIYEGRNRQIRRMMAHVGHPVKKLQRVAYGNLRLGRLNSGTWRKLLPNEVQSLLAGAKPAPTPPKSPRPAKSKRPFLPKEASDPKEPS